MSADSPKTSDKMLRNHDILSIVALGVSVISALFGGWAVYTADQALKISMLVELRTELNAATDELLRTVRQIDLSPADLKLAFYRWDVTFSLVRDASAAGALTTGDWINALDPLCTLFSAADYGLLSDGAYGMETLKNECEKEGLPRS